MSVRPIRFVPQPLTMLLMSFGALLALAWSWTRPEANSIDVISIQSTLVALFLVVTVVLADFYPIQIRPHVKASVSTVPLYLIAVLLPPPLAALSAGLGLFAAEMLTRKVRGVSLADLFTSTARWIIVVLLGSLVAHLPSGDAIVESLLLLGTAGVMFSADMLLSAFEIAPLSGDALWYVVFTTVRDAGLLEGVQYFLGMLGALAARQQVLALLLLLLPSIIIYFAFKNAKEIRRGTRELLELMADTVDLRDPYTGGHSRRVAQFAHKIVQELNITYGPDRDLIELGARLHDIGKIGLPDSLLKKTGKLTAEEWMIMASHAQRGADLLTRYPDFARGSEIVRHHHEHWDGQGYPLHLSGSDIPLGARIIAVADSFDAMTTDRPYRRAMSVQQAAMILWEGRGRQWDKDVVDAFLRSIANELPEDLFVRTRDAKEELGRWGAVTE